MFNNNQAKYGVPANQAHTTSQQWRDFVIVGKDREGNSSVVSTLSKDETEALIRDAAPGLVAELAGD